MDPGPPTSDIYGAEDAAYIASLVDRENGEYHLLLQPLADSRRNRLRELWVDAKTYQTRQAVVEDRLFIQVGPIVPTYFQIEFVDYQGMPVIFRIQAVVRWTVGGRESPALNNEYLFTDISFPKSLPTWYFQPKAYREHIADAPAN